MEKIRVYRSQVIYTRNSAVLIYECLSKARRYLVLGKMLHARRIMAIIFLFISLLGIAFYYIWTTNSADYDTSTWICLNRSCVNCLKVEVPSINFNSTVCTTIKYLSEDIGVSFVILDTTKDVSVNRTLPAQSLLLLRLQEPFVEKPSEIHVYFDSVVVTHNYLRACGIIEVRKNFLFLQEFKMGCFNVSSAAVSKVIVK